MAANSARRLGLNVAIFRLSGIYGQAATPSWRWRAEPRNGSSSPDRFQTEFTWRISRRFCRIDRPPAPGAIYNVSDNEPAPPQDIIAFAAQLAGIPDPPDIPIEQAELSPMSKSFYAENKRISNRLHPRGARRRLRYPTYREGFDGALRQRRIRQRHVTVGTRRRNGRYSAD